MLEQQSSSTPHKEHSTKEIPNTLTCPLTKQLFMEPVITANHGNTYEREAIEDRQVSENRDPLTMKELTSKVLTINRAIQSSVEEFLKKNPELAGERYISKKKKEELNKILRERRITSVQEAVRIFDFDPRFLTLPIDKDYRAIHIAAQFGSVQMTEKILTMLEQKNQVKSIIPTPTHFDPKNLNELVNPALDKFDKTRLENLLYFGVDLEQPSSHNGSTLLHCMIKSESENAAAWLLDNNVKIDAETTNRNTALHLAILKSNQKLTKLLLAKQASRTVQNKWKLTCTGLAILLGKKEIIDLLLEKTPLERARKFSTTTLMAISVEDDTLLRILVNEVKIGEVMKEMCRDESIQVPQSEFEKSDIRNCDKLDDQTGKGPLYAAVQSNRDETVKIILEAKPKLERKYGDEKQTILHICCAKVPCNMASLLLKNCDLGPIINEPDVNGNTALHLVVQKENPEEHLIEDLLIKGGSNHELRNSNGDTASMIASRARKIKIANCIAKFAFQKRSNPIEAVCTQIAVHYDQKIKELEARMDRMEKQMQEQYDRKLSEMEKAFKSKLKALEDKMGNRLEDFGGIETE